MRTDRLFWIQLWRWLGAIALVLLLLIPAAPVLADAGPKPGMLFKFIYEVQSIQLLSGELIVCQQADCSDGVRLMEAGPQRF